jgi:hypothetical protein
VVRGQWSVVSGQGGRRLGSWEVGSRVQGSGFRVQGSGSLSLSGSVRSDPPSRYNEFD